VLNITATAAEHGFRCSQTKCTYSLQCWIGRLKKKATAKKKSTSGQQKTACLAQKGSTTEQGTHQIIQIRKNCTLFAENQ